jgi:hypothetical protein
MLKTGEKIVLLLCSINIGIWIFNLKNKLDIFDIVIGIIPILFAYILVYCIINICLYNFARALLKKTTSYFQEQYKLNQFEFRQEFYSSIVRQFTSYLFFFILLIDSISLVKYKISVLSYINTFVSNS